MHPSPVIERSVVSSWLLLSSVVVLDDDVPIYIAGDHLFLVDIDRPRGNAGPIKVSPLPHSFRLVIARLSHQRLDGRRLRASMAPPEMAEKVVGRV